MRAISATSSDADAASRDADVDPPSLATLYATHYTRLVRVAWLLVRDAGRAEELVQDAFVDLHGRWSTLRDPASAGGYLHTSVINRCRSALRHLAVVRAHPTAELRDVDRTDSAETDVLVRLERRQVLDRLDALPRRQREVLVLRYYGELSEAEIAGALGISRGAVKSHSSRGLAALRPVLGRNA